MHAEISAGNQVLGGLSLLMVYQSSVLFSTGWHLLLMVGAGRVQCLSSDCSCSLKR